MPQNNIPSRMQSLQQKMKDQQVELVAIAPGPHMIWLLGIIPPLDERPCLLIISQHSKAFLMPILNAEDAKQHSDFTMFTWSDTEGPEGALKKLLASISLTHAKSIALDETMRADFALLVVDALPQSKRQFTASTVGELRMRKDSSEYDSLKANALIADKAFKAAWAMMAPGVSELEVAEVIRSHFTNAGAKPLFAIVGSGSNGAFPHHSAGERKLEAGDAVVMDIGARKDRYSSDTTRMVAIEHAPEGYDEVHQVVERAVQAAINTARPGVKAYQVDEAARNVINEAGYGKYFIHRTGHGIGLEGHEPPYLNGVSQTILEAGMTFSIEPGIYLPDRFGIRLEEIVMLRDDGPEVLSELPRELVIIS